MGERLANCVRIEESHRALKGLKGQIKKWADRRHSLDVLDQYDAHVSVLESVLLPVLDALAAALDRIDSGRPVGEVYAQCRRTDDGVAFVGRIWEWFRAKFDQRDDPVIRRLLAAADEVVWSCYAEVFDNAAAVSGREVPRGLVPLPYIEFRFAPTATPRRLVPPDLRPRSGDEIMRVFLERLPLPLVGLPLAWLEAPWWLLLLGHEVGHQIQFELMPEFSLVTEFGELVSRAAAAGGELDASRWRAWSQEIFADLCLLCTGGPWGIWSVAGQDLADERTMLADRGPFPPPVVRLALLAAAAATLGVDGHAGMRGIDLNGLVADAEGTVKSDLALAPQIAIAALGHRLGGLGSFAELFAFDPDDFRPGGSVARWARALRTPGSSVHESPVRSGRLIACGAVAAWSEVAVIADAAERKKARKMLQKAVLRELTHGRQEATEGATRAAEPSAVPGPGDLAELRQLILAEFAQLGGEVVQLKGSVGRIEAGVSEITKVTAMVQDQLRRWTVSQETISGTPRLFTLTPVSKRGLDKAAVWQDTYQLTLWCEHDDQPHLWPPARYQFSRPKDWMVTVAPYALGVLYILRLAVKVTVPITALADLASIKDDLDAMGKLLDQFPKQLPGITAAPGQAAQSIRADGPELRALRALLTELDPKRKFNGMHPVAIPSGDIRWVCQVHYAAYNPGVSTNTR